MSSEEHAPDEPSRELECTEFHLTHVGVFRTALLAALLSATGALVAAVILLLLSREHEHAVLLYYPGAAFIGGLFGSLLLMLLVNFYLRLVGGIPLQLTLPPKPAHEPTPTEPLTDPLRPAVGTSEQKPCPSCGASIRADRSFCPNCDHSF